MRAAAYDGDTPMDERDWARSHANWVFTNPDMLHRGLLPGHARWARVLRRLRFVVIDECHAYRGVFGSHVALVLRRLIRLAARVRRPTGVRPRVGDSPPIRPASAARLIGRPVLAVTEDGAPRRAPLRAVGAAVLAGDRGGRRAGPPVRSRRRRPG